MFGVGNLADIFDEKYFELLKTYFCMLRVRTTLAMKKQAQLLWKIRNQQVKVNIHKGQPFSAYPAYSGFMYCHSRAIHKNRPVQAWFCVCDYMCVYSCLVFYTSIIPGIPVHCTHTTAGA